MTAAPAISVVVLAYESGATLERCLQALRVQTFRDFEVVLADNGSGDGAAQAAAGADPTLVFVDNRANLGFAEGCNRAAERATGRWLAFLNPDAFPEPDWLERLHAATVRRPEDRCFTSLQIADDDPRLLDGAGDAMSAVGLPWRAGHRRPRPSTIAEGEVFSPCGAAMLIERATFERLGGFEPGFFCYCEDVDLGFRLRLTGGRTVLVPNAIVRHVGSATLGARSEIALFHGTRNRAWTWIRCAPPWLLIGTIAVHALATLLLWALAPARERGVIGRALNAAWAGRRTVWEARERVQKTRTVSTLTIWHALNPDPLAAIRRALDVRPL